MEPSGTNSAPVSAKKPLIDNMLAPEQKSTFDAEKAAELFVDDQRASIVVSYILLCIESCNVLCRVQYLCMFEHMCGCLCDSPPC